MTKSNKTKKVYEYFLNSLSVSEEEMIIGGKLRKGKYGTMLRKYDKIAFNVGYREYVDNIKTEEEN